MTPTSPETVAMAKKDGITLESRQQDHSRRQQGACLHDVVAPTYGINEIKVKKGDEVTVTITNLDQVEDVSTALR